MCYSKYSKKNAILKNTISVTEPKKPSFFLFFVCVMISRILCTFFAEFRGEMTVPCNKIPRTKDDVIKVQFWNAIYSIFKMVFLFLVCSH